MRNIILFIVFMVCACIVYDKFGRRSVYPVVVAECVVQQKTKAEGRDSLYAVIAEKKIFITHVLDDAGMWVYPSKDSVVTAFVTAKNKNLQFMQGKVNAEDIDRSFQQQIPRIIMILGFVCFVILIQYYQSEKDIVLPDDCKS